MSTAPAPSATPAHRLLVTSYLRRKLDVHGPLLIHTLRGVGYVLRAPKA
jgi:DNA-binding response OmpR family regulator